MAVQNIEKRKSSREKRWRQESMSDAEEGEPLEVEQEIEVGGVAYIIECHEIVFCL